jgi:hypothetical protein
MQHPPRVRGHVVALLSDRMTAGATITRAADVAVAQALDLVLVPITDGVGTSRPTGSWLAQRLEDLRSAGTTVSAAVVPRSTQRGAAVLRDARVVVVPLHALAEVLPDHFRKVLVVDCHKGPRPQQRVVAAVLTGGPADETVVAAAADEARARRCELRLIHPDESEAPPWTGAGDSWVSRRAARRHSHAHVRSPEGLSVSTFCAAGEFEHAVPRYASNVELLVTACTGDAETDLQRVRLVAQSTSNVLLLQDTAPPAVPRPGPVAPAAITVMPLVAAGTADAPNETTEARGGTTWS